MYLRVLECLIEESYCVESESAKATGSIAAHVLFQETNSFFTVLRTPFDNCPVPFPCILLHDWAIGRVPQAYLGVFHRFGANSWAAEFLDYTL